MKILVYKRTHDGDPNSSGQFGIEDCMGRVRDCKFDAVVGVGGIGYEAKSNGIDRKINWVGIGAHKHPLTNARGQLITFDHFILFESAGIDLQAIAPDLAQRMYARHAPRFVLIDGSGKTGQPEINSILALAKHAAPSVSTRISKMVCGATSIAARCGARSC